MDSHPSTKSSEAQKVHSSQRTFLASLDMWITFRTSSIRRLNICKSWKFRYSISLLDKMHILTTNPEKNFDVLAVLALDLFEVPRDLGHELQNDLGVDGAFGRWQVDGTAHVLDRRESLRKQEIERLRRKETKGSSKTHLRFVFLEDHPLVLRQELQNEGPELGDLVGQVDEGLDGDVLLGQTEERLGLLVEGHGRGQSGKVDDPGDLHDLGRSGIVTES